MTEQGTRSELIIALVCPLGARIELLQKTVSDELKNFSYRCENIHISDLLKNFESTTVESDGSEYARINNRQSQAFKFRTKGGPAVLARAAIAAIRESRLRISHHPDKPAEGWAFILRQLKHPKEIELLRRVYGQSVVVIAGHAPKDMRIKTLADTLARSEGQPSSQFEKWARELIDTDEKEENPDDEELKFGQNTRDAYPLADFFANLAHIDPDPVKRFISLLFGHPFHSPTPEEMAMHQANAMALRSSDERRQVGAVIVSRTKRSNSDVLDADILASGMNEVPRREGGYYWETKELVDARDQALRRSNPKDREDLIKSHALREIVSRLKRNKWLAPEYSSLHERDLAEKLLPLLKRTQFTDISEFMRQVHAEMAALVDAAKRGVAVRGGEMFVTTFPCHSCAKHIIAAGIIKVVYLEPYAKSRVKDLHEEEVALDPADPKTVGDKVLFEPFTGIAPRQYARLFSMASRSHKNGGLPLNEWNDNRSTRSPLYVLAHAAEAYTHTEREELERLPQEYKWNRAVLCPTQ